MTTQPEDDQKLLIDRLIAMDLEIKELNSENNRLKAQVSTKLNDAASMAGRLRQTSKSLHALNQELLEVKHSRLQYFRALRWLILNSLKTPDGMPGWVIKTLAHVVKASDEGCD